MTVVDFNLVKQRSKFLFDRYVTLYQKELIVPENKKPRLGFYFLWLSSFHNLSLEQCEKIIIDGDFRKTLDKKGNDDLGVDAVYIDEEKKTVYLYQFKYREQYDAESRQNDSAFHQAMPFLVELNTLLSKDIIQESDYIKFSDKTREAMITLVEYLQPMNDYYEIFLCQVSNEIKKSKEIEKQTIKDTNLITDAKAFVLGDVLRYTVGKKEKINCRFSVSEGDSLKYVTDPFSTDTHYAVSLKLLELLRITCDNEELRDNVETESTDFKLNVNVLSDNVRGYILKSKYNISMLETIKESPENFFLYNNGVTIISDRIEVRATPTKKTGIFSLKNIQVVNGGQTLRTLYRYIEDNPSEWKSKIAEANVLVKIVTASGENDIASKVAEYTNSQNPISEYDLKAMDSIQIKLEDYFNHCGILFIRKNGDIGKHIDSKYTMEVEMTYLGQLLYSKLGYPNRAVTQKKKIFTDRYNEVFNRENILEVAYESVEWSYKVREFYQSMQIQMTDQKLFYIIHAVEIFMHQSLENGGERKNISVDGVMPAYIEILELLLKHFESDSEISHARKLLLLDFKELFDYIINLENSELLNEEQLVEFLKIKNHKSELKI